MVRANNPGGREEAPPSLAGHLCPVGTQSDPGTGGGGTGPGPG